MINACVRIGTGSAALLLAHLQHEAAAEDRFPIGGFMLGLQFLQRVLVPPKLLSQGAAKSAAELPMKAGNALCLAVLALGGTEGWPSCYALASTIAQSSAICASRLWMCSSVLLFIAVVCMCQNSASRPELHTTQNFGIG